MASSRAALTGAYRPTQPGDLKALFFDSNRYVVVWASGEHCPDPAAAGGACVESGTYTIDGAGTALQLTDDESKKTSPLPFVAGPAVATGKIAPASLAPLDDAPALDDPPSTDEAPTLSGPSLSLTEDRSAPIMQSATISGQPVQLVDVPSEVRGRLAHCFDHDWSKMPMEATSNPNYTSSGVDRVIGEVARPGLLAADAAGRLLFRNSQGARTLDSVEQGIQKTVADHPELTDYQRAALVTCVSSNLINYGNNLVSFATGSTGAVNQGEGVCREYAAIAKRLYGAAGLSGGIVLGARQTGLYSSGGHAWNWVHLPSQQAWYQMEPQDDPADDRIPFFNRQESPSPCEMGGAFCTQGVDSCTSTIGGGVPTGESCSGAAGGGQCCMLTAPVY